MRMFLRIIVKYLHIWNNFCTFADEFENETIMSAKNVPIKDSYIGSMFAKMLADKRTISAYIHRNGTLVGFSDDSIKLAQPL